MQSDWPAAPFSKLGDGADPDEHVWVRADPVHLAPQQTSLVLVDVHRARLFDEESNALLAAVNAHLAQDGLSLSAHHPRRWYLRAPRQLQVRTTPTEIARGMSVDPLLPQGPDALLLHGWVNEIQMLLHEHPVNAAREARGALPVNSIWLWGAGQLVRAQPPTAGAVWTLDPLLRGLARAGGLPAYAPPASAADWTPHAETGTHWILFDADETTEDAAAAPERHGQAERLEALWFAPLLAALSARRLGKLALTTRHRGRVLRFSIGAGDLWKVWRRRIGLVHA